MKIPELFLLTILVIFYASCQPSIEADFGVATQYFPTSTQLQRGIVSKYHDHFTEVKNKEISTNISYQTYQLEHPNQLKVQNYNAALTLETATTLGFQGEKMLYLEQTELNNGDTLSVTIEQPTRINWATDTATFQKTIVYEWGKIIWQINQLTNRDTSILDKPAKIFESKQKATRIIEGDSTEFIINVKQCYVAGIGLFSSESNSKNWQSKTELVEQLYLEEFEKRANHKYKRVAYIDPETVLDKNSDFQLCENRARIFDYYNGQPPAGFNGGKGALKRAILPKVDATKLHGASGFLTFRFVINCNGEIGWFTTEQADLAYQKKQFNPATVQHFYEIISSLTTWHPTVIREKQRDAYAYLTIKLKDGAIIDFLP